MTHQILYVTTDDIGVNSTTLLYEYYNFNTRFGADTVVLMAKECEVVFDVRSDPNPVYWSTYAAGVMEALDTVVDLLHPKTVKASIIVRRDLETSVLVRACYDVQLSKTPDPNYVKLTLTKEFGSYDQLSEVSTDGRSYMDWQVHLM